MFFNFHPHLDRQEGARRGQLHSGGERNGNPGGRGRKREGARMREREEREGEEGEEGEGEKSSRVYGLLFVLSTVEPLLSPVCTH